MLYAALSGDLLRFDHDIRSSAAVADVHDTLYLDLLSVFELLCLLLQLVCAECAVGRIAVILIADRSYGDIGQLRAYIRYLTLELYLLVVLLLHADSGILVVALVDLVKILSVVPLDEEHEEKCGENNKNADDKPPL